MGIAVGSRGWDHDHWAGSYYPHDLPPEWRLGYYANEFRGVLLPAPALAAAGAQTLTGWLDDMPEGFALWLELDPATLAAAGPRLALLAPRLVGMVVTGAAPDSDGLGRLRDALPAGVACALPPAWRDVASAQPSPAWCYQWQGGAPEGPVCVWLPEALPRTTRELGDGLKAFAAAARGCSQGLVAFPAGGNAPLVMEQAQTILDLLGA